MPQRLDLHTVLGENPYSTHALLASVLLAAYFLKKMLLLRYICGGLTNHRSTDHVICTYDLL